VKAAPVVTSPTAVMSPPEPVAEIVKVLVVLSVAKVTPDPASTFNPVVVELAVIVVWVGTMIEENKFWSPVFVPEDEPEKLEAVNAPVTLKSPAIKVSPEASSTVNLSVLIAKVVPSSVNNESESPPVVLLHLVKVLAVPVPLAILAPPIVTEEARLKVGVFPAVKVPKVV
jgi:hypothetical protein